MGQKKYPPLPRDVFEAIIISIFGPNHRKSGDHRIYVGRVNGKAAIAQVDHGRDLVFGEVIKRTIENCNMTREQFYGCHKTACKKISVRHVPFNEIVFN